MNDFPSFNSSINFNKSLSLESCSQDCSIETQKKSKGNSSFQEKQKSFQHSQKLSHRSQHTHDSFDEANKSDVELGIEIQRGFSGYKKIKSETLEISDNDLHNQMRVEEEKDLKQSSVVSSRSISLLDRIFAELKLSRGESSIFYQHSQSQEEDRIFALESIQEMFRKQCRIASSSSITWREESTQIKEEEKDAITFEYFEFDVKDYIVLEILGEGLHGLVIKLKKINNHDEVVIKLYRKENEKTFIDETVILSISQKAKELSPHKRFGLDTNMNTFQNIYFKTEQYYGLFIKAGIGSLLDFKNYLKDTEAELTYQELFILTWFLLDSYHCLIEANLCHRDIKPQNIVIDSETFLPELIDFSLASEISKVRGTVGTQGYRMEDFGMEDSMEKDQQDQVISNDYFALGKTLLEIAFPTFIILTLKDIKNRLEKLEKVKEKQIIANALRICIFGNLRNKKEILKDHMKNYFDTPFWEENDETKRKASKYIQDNFNPMGLNTEAEIFRNRHFENFKNYMAKRFTMEQDNVKPKLQEITSSLTCEPDQIDARENYNKGLRPISEEKEFYNEEQFLKNNFIKYPEKTMEVCYEVIYKLVMRDHQTFDSQLYSILMTILYFNNYLDDAIALGEKVLQFQEFEERNWIFLNNFSFLMRQRTLRDYPHILSNPYKYHFSYFMKKFQDLFVEDLMRICRRPSCYSKAKASIWNQKCIPEKWDFNEKEPLLTDFEMDLIHKESNFYLSFCFVQASGINKIIDNQTREKIKEFVYGVNISDREEMLDFFKITPKESVLLTFLNFCDLFSSIAFTEIPDLKEELEGVLALRKELANWLREEGKLWNYLFHYMTFHLMFGFIILYNVKYDLRATIFDEKKWKYSWEAKKLRRILLEEEFQKLENWLRAERYKLWNRQNFLDSIIFYFRGAYGEIIRLPISSDFQTPSHLSCLSIFGRELGSLFLPDPALKEKLYELKIDFTQDSIFISAKKMKFGLSEDDIGTIQNSLDNFDMKDLEHLESLKLEFYDYHEDFSHILFEKISHRLSNLKLQKLEIKMEKKIRITDADFELISKFIFSQTQLNHLTIKFDLCLITSKTIESLADGIGQLKKLQEVNLVFQNCPAIERESISTFLEKINTIQELKFVNLSFGACSGLTFFVKPPALSFKLEIEINLLGLTLESDGDDSQCFSYPTNLSDLSDSSDFSHFEESKSDFEKWKFDFEERENFLNEQTTPFEKKKVESLIAALAMFRAHVKRNRNKNHH